MANTLEDNMISVALTIICGGDKAYNVPQIPGPPPPPFTNIFFDDQPPPKYDGWFMQRYEDQAAYTIRNAASGYYACACDGNVKATPDFDPKTCLWYITKAGGVQYKISVPNQDRVWTVRETNGPKTVTLEGADGSPEQVFTFGFAQHV